MALNAYFDDSMTVGKVLVFAGYIARAEAWADFSVEWRKRLKESGLVEFKMSERAGCHDEMNGYFHRVIEQYVDAMVCCCVPIAILREEVAAAGFDARVANPYRMALKGILHASLSWESLLSDGETIEFMFDEKDDMRIEINAQWDNMLRSLTEAERQRVTGVPMFRQSHIHMPLQAADMAAWWYRTCWLEGKPINIGYPFPWNVKKDYRRLIGNMTRENIRDSLRQVADGIVGRFKTSATFSFAPTTFRK